MPLEALLQFTGSIHVVDIGAAAINETPPYKPLLQRGTARLTAVDGDDRQQEAMRSEYGEGATLVAKVIADGARRTLHLTRPSNGMTSLLKPDRKQLPFFNGFTVYGAVERELPVQTHRLADVPELQGIDYLKMDVQGAEMMILENAGSALDRCVAIQTEASFIPLYEDQPTFADIDRWMRSHGFLPHCFTEVKRWSIAPTVANGDIRNPFNQLLECDIVYVRGLVGLSALDDEQLKKLALISAQCYSSPDLCLHAVLELEKRGMAGLNEQVLRLFADGNI
jgi:FkbM family methyltransferase